jgi:SpoIIAA-like
MLERISGLPDNVLGITAKGEVTGADYETVLIPAVEEMLVNRERIRFMYQLGDEFTGFDAKAIWDDAKVGLQHLAAWERVAVVTDVTWIRTTMKVFGFVIPGEVRVFSNSETAQARLWLSEPPVTG